jgi:GMP synthase-like glutamine amidotransferase
VRKELGRQPPQVANQPTITMPNCLIVQHIAPESSFAIGEVLDGAGVALDVRQVFEGQVLPATLDGFDGLVVMGGPMSAASDDGFPSRGAELTLIGEALALGVPTLGVCLGAQLLAVAAGAAVYPGARGPEIGWGPVDLLAACGDDPLFTGLPTTLTVMHWHGDTFDLPAGAVSLMTNGNYVNQGFRIGEAAWGVQFHLEVTERAVEGFIAEFGTEAELAPGGAAAIRLATGPSLASLAESSTLAFQRFAALVVARVQHGDLVDSP